MISIVAAMGRHRVIGHKNRLPWRLPADLAYFKKITMGHTVIMGRKTFESIGKPLPGRKNIILTRETNYRREGCVVLPSVESIRNEVPGGEEAFVIGGGEVFGAFLPLAGRLYLTMIDAEFSGDVFFPEWRPIEWRLLSRTQGPKDEKNNYHYFFEVYERVIPE